jgi:hypothetical protein
VLVQWGIPHGLVFKVSSPEQVLKVQKIIKPIDSKLPAEVAVDGAEDLYREIRVENKLKDESGDDVALKEGAPVKVSKRARRTRFKSQRNRENKRDT